jgi:acyl-CoA thioesterase II
LAAPGSGRVPDRSTSGTSTTRRGSPPDDDRPRTQQVWLRTAGRLRDDPLLHVCAVTYASDMTLLDSVLLAHGLSWDGGRRVRVASLDHAMWFHHPFRADDWLLYDQSSPVASGARGLAIGRLWTRDGRHVVSVVQEGLLRVVDDGKDTAR